MSSDALKRQAAGRALDYVRPGMRLGLGTGSTAKHFVELLGERVRDGLDVIGVPTSEQTRADAMRCGVRLTTLEETPHLDLTVDGADEMDEALRLIKGGGGALLREKIVASASARFVIIADNSKLVENLGKFPLPLEVVPFGLTATKNLVTQLAGDAGCTGEILLRRKHDGGVFLTDNGNYILDCAFGEIGDPETLDDALKLIPGVVENGLFLGLADLGVVAGPEGVTVIATDELDFEDEDFA